jgi:L-lactate dehydrogenase (cytochrome)
VTQAPHPTNRSPLLPLAASDHTPASDPWGAFNGTASDRRFRNLLSLNDFEAAAQRVLPRPIFGYVSGAAEDNQSLGANRAAFADWDWLPRVLCNVAQRSQRVTLFGQRFASPFGIAPMGLAALSAYRGDIALAQAAAAAHIPSVLSGSSLTRLEDVMAAAPGTWFQAYLPGEMARIDGLIQRVAAAGVHTLVITVDIPVAGNRENNVRAGFSTPLRPSLRLAWDGLTRPRWLVGTLGRTLWHHGMPHFENSFAERGAPILSARVQRDFAQRDHFDWTHIAHVRKLWRGALVIKGILHADDAALALQHGADGIIVSNHGGRQLDGAVAPLRVLPSIKAKSGGMTVMLDSGVRRGSDVLKAMALGANAVFVGRPFNHALAVAGDAGVAHAIALLRAEVDRNLAMLGAADVTQLGPQHLHDARG